MIKKFELNEKGRDFVVGDIHGCFDLLSNNLKEIGFDESVDRLFSVGDLVDRGKQSEDCIK
jgi:serine/threonine protein phosphatase 1